MPKIQDNAANALLDGAFEQFARHGFAKSSMSDIAKAAGVSRTSLYNNFPNKKDVFRALSERLNTGILDAIVKATETRGSLETRLLAIIDARVSWLYEILHSSGHGRELINERNPICGDQVSATNDRVGELITDMLNKELGENPRNAFLARVLIEAVNGVLESARAMRGAEESVSALVSTFCAGVIAKYKK